MRDNTLPQTNWDEIEAFETELIRAKTIQEKVQDYLDLMRTHEIFFKPSYQQYTAEREKALIAVQRKLMRLGEYERTHRPKD